MSYKYQVKIGGRNFVSDLPFTVTLDRTITYSNGEKKAIQVTKEAYCRTMNDDDSPKRQKLQSYKYNGIEPKNYQQFILPKQIATNYYDLRGNNGTINFGC